MAEAIIANADADLARGLAEAEAVAKAGHPLAAFVHLSNLHHRIPDSPAPLLRAMDLLRRADRPALAIAVAEEAHLLFPREAQFLLAVAEARQLATGYQDAQPLWQRVREALPHHHAGWTMPARMLRDAGKFDDADALLAEAVRLRPRDPSVFSEWAWVAQIRRDWPVAQQRWATARERFPRLAAGFVQGATSARELGDTDTAKALLDQAIESMPRESVPLIERARLAVVLSDIQHATELWQTVRDRFPDHLAGYTEGAKLLARSGNLDDAEAVLAAATRCFADNPALMADYASLVARRREVAAAS